MSTQNSILADFEEINGVHIGLATHDDEAQIGLLSKELIEFGLSHWVWNPHKVSDQIRNPDSLVLVAKEENDIVGFSIAHFGTQSTELLLLGVCLEHQRMGVGARMVRIMERSAVVNGHTSIQLEVRSNNRTAIMFYKKLGFKELRIIPRYYSNRESAIRMKHDLTRHPANFPTFS